MGRDLYALHAAAREVFDRADAILGRALSRLCFEGSDAELNKTANAQPAIFVTSMARLEVARQTGELADEPAFVAGHSLGEYTALAAAGAIDFDAALRLVERRGELTQAAAERTPGGMAAVLGLEEDALQAVCDEAGAEVCNLNAPGQVVIGGGNDALERACALAVERGARRAVPLDVIGAFHTSLMQPAVEAFAQAVDAVEVRAPRAPFVANRTAAAMTDPADIKDELVYQLTHPVRWVHCVQYMAAHGVTSIVEIGPGRVLTGLIKRIAPSMTLSNLSGATSLSR